MASFPVQGFNIQAGLNTIGPVTSPVAIGVLKFDIDMAELVPLQPLNPPMLITCLSSQNNGQTWDQEFFIDVVTLGQMKDGTVVTRLQPSETITPPIQAGTRVRLLVDSPVAFHSTGGSITVT